LVLAVALVFGNNVNFFSKSHIKLGLNYKVKLDFLLCWPLDLWKKTRVFIINYLYTIVIMTVLLLNGSYHDRNRMVVGFTTKCAISAYHHQRCEIEPRSWWDVLDITLCDKVFCLWFSPVTPVSFTNKTLPWCSWIIVESGVKHHKPNLLLNDYFKQIVHFGLVLDLFNKIHFYAKWK
jgi:hypothetical protein